MGHALQRAIRRRLAPPAFFVTGGSALRKGPLEPNVMRPLRVPTVRHVSTEFAANPRAAALVKPAAWERGSAVCSTKGRNPWLRILPVAATRSALVAATAGMAIVAVSPVRSRRAQPLPARTNRVCGPRAPAMGKVPVELPPSSTSADRTPAKPPPSEVPSVSKAARAARIARVRRTATNRETACAATIAIATGFGAIERPTSVSAAVKRARRTARAVTTAIHWSTAVSRQSPSPRVHYLRAPWA